MSVLELERTRQTRNVELSRVAVEANRDLTNASATEILTWAHREFGARLVVTASMADTVLIHLAEHAAPGLDVVFLDTGYHFAETIGTRDAVAAVHKVNLITITPRQTVAEQDATWGKDLFRRDPDRCCALRKVAPLDETLSRYEAWASGVRRADSRARERTPVVSWDLRRKILKLAPLARWTDDDVDDYIATNGLMVNPLLDDGYGSIGCEPCTIRSANRTGRWAGLAKTECGIFQ